MVFLVVGAELAILGVDVLAGGDRLGRVADDLAELGDGAAERDRLAGDLVPGHDRGVERRAEAERARALRRARGQDRDIVGGVEDEGGGAVVEHGYGHWFRRGTSPARASVITAPAGCVSRQNGRPRRGRLRP